MTDDDKKPIFGGITNPGKLKKLLDEMEIRKIRIPTKDVVKEIFKDLGWKISDPQAWQYKRKAEEEIRKKERATEATK
jgi:vacuolar-type H+-ATPase subunit I/STV1